MAEPVPSEADLARKRREDLLEQYRVLCNSKFILYSFITEKIFLGFKAAETYIVNVQSIYVRDTRIYS